MPSRNKLLDWSATAARVLIDGLVHIAEDSPQGARLVKGRIDRAGHFLEQNPRMGKPGAVAGTREYPVPLDSLRNAEQIDQWHREKGMLAFSLREPQAGGSVVDVIVRPEVSFETLMANAAIGELLGRHVPIASIDDLLVMKRAANRPKDRLDIEALEKIRRGEDPNA